MPNLAGNDTIQINDRILTNFGDGDVLNLTYANNLVTAKRGKNGNTLFALNATGVIADVELRIIKGTPDDKYLNSLMLGQAADFPSFALLTGTFTKRIGDGASNVTSETYQLNGGVFMKAIDDKENTEGNTDQLIAVYRLQFANSDNTGRLLS